MFRNREIETQNICISSPAGRDSDRFTYRLRYIYFLAGPTNQFIQNKLYSDAHIKNDF